jgi:hypothetical protein
MAAERRLTRRLRDVITGNCATKTSKKTNEWHIYLLQLLQSVKTLIENEIKFVWLMTLPFSLA